MPIKRRYSLYEEAFDIIDEQSAYWTGFIMADGFVQFLNDRRQLRVGIHLGEVDSSHIEKFASFLRTDMPVKHYEQYQPLLGKMVKSAKIQIHSDRIGNRLIELGVGLQKGGRMCNSVFIDNRDFWRGMFDGDGCIFKSNRGDWIIRFSGSENIVGQFSTFVETRVGLIPTIYRQNSHWGSCWYWNLNGKERAKDFMNEIYDGSSTYLDRKMQVYRQLMSIT
jgi:hypothetical protein